MEKPLSGKRVAVLVETEFIPADCYQTRFPDTYAPSSSHVVVDHDVVTARSAADLDAYFNTIVETAIARS